MTNRNPWILYGTAWKKERTADLVETAVKLGFTAIDIANQPKHYNEPGVGEALQRLAKQGIARSSLFLQTKFTPLDGQDHRVPYDPKATLRDQVFQSFQSSLDHLHTDYLDSLLLHGPYGHPHWGDEDREVWAAFEELHEKKKVRHIGVSNINIVQLQELCAEASMQPAVVQNRCFANRGWDREIREFCLEKQILYQGFSLLTANPHVVGHPITHKIATHIGGTSEQVILRFATQIGITPLTGTTDPTHMKEDLSIQGFELSAEDIQSVLHLESSVSL